MPTSTRPPEHVAVSPVFRLELVASPDEIDELEHVSNIAYLQWVQRIARAHSSAVGYDWAAYRKLGAIFVVRRHEIDYLSSAFEGDAIVLTTWIESWTAASSTRKTTITRGSDGVLLANVSTLWAMMSMAEKRPIRIPDDLKDSFRQPV